LAERKDRLVSVRQCFCGCQKTDGKISVDYWGWSSGRQCNQVGKSCAGVHGKYVECSECLAKNEATGKYSQCQKFATANISTAPGGGVIKPPAELPSTNPFSKSGMNAPKIQYRGVEAEGSGSSPAEQEDKTPAPK
jgi:hypothetical protein